MCLVWFPKPHSHQSATEHEVSRENKGSSGQAGSLAPFLSPVTYPLQSLYDG